MLRLTDRSAPTGEQPGHEISPIDTTPEMGLSSVHEDSDPASLRRSKSVPSSRLPSKWSSNDSYLVLLYGILIFALQIISYFVIGQ